MTNNAVVDLLIGWSMLAALGLLAAIFRELRKIERLLYQLFLTSRESSHLTVASINEATASLSRKISSDVASSKRKTMR